MVSIETEESAFLQQGSAGYYIVNTKCLLNSKPMYGNFKVKTNFHSKFVDSGRLIKYSLQLNMAPPGSSGALN